MQTQHDVHMWAGDLRESKQREGLWLLSQEDGWQASQSKQLWLCQQAGLGPVTEVWQLDVISIRMWFGNSPLILERGRWADGENKAGPHSRRTLCKKQVI